MFRTKKIHHVGPQSDMVEVTANIAMTAIDECYHLHGKRRTKHMFRMDHTKQSKRRSGMFLQPAEKIFDQGAQ
jgi:hypothetical protein